MFQINVGLLVFCSR